MKSLCVFCGSSPGARPAYTEATEDLASLMVRDGIRLVFGGASVGLMGRLADTVMSEGGEAVGVIPQSLVDREIAHLGLTDLHVVASMHERKAKMAELSEGFVALPGGLGTLDELFEIYTWGQLGLHRKPVGLLNVEGYYDGLAAFLAQAVEEGFMREEHRAMLMLESTPDGILLRLRDFDPATLRSKWSEPESS